MRLPDPPRISNLTSLIPFGLGYGLFAAAAHVDILIAYFYLPTQELGVYSALPVLPKGPSMLTLPIIQLAFPMMVGRQAASLPSGVVIVKGLVLTTLLSSLGAGAIMALSEPACSGRLGFRACDPTTMSFGLLAIIVFEIVRFLVSVDFSAKRDLMPSALAVPLGLYCAFAGYGVKTPTALAQGFVLFSLATLLFYLLLRLVPFGAARAKPETL